MIILAHRGWWHQRDERNSPLALKRAFAAGYGAETDVRDLAGRLVISHDPPDASATYSFDQMLDDFVVAGKPGVLAINIKADGLHAPIRDALGKRDIGNAFVFDMSVPDALGYIRQGMSTFTRQSEYEQSPSFHAEASGVWMDAFKSDWISPADLTPHLSAGKQVALVSPELHGRPHEQTWAAWRDCPTDVMLCTDFPDAADLFFNAPVEHPRV